MKGLIIIAVLVAASFLGLLIYGKAQENGGHEDGQPAGFGSATEPKPDQLESWKPPPIISSTTWLQERFAPSLGLKPPAHLTNTSPTSDSINIPALKGAVPGKPDPKNVRLAKISLTEGQSALLEQDDHRLCLCTSGSGLPDMLFADGACDKRWRTKNARRVCEPDQTSGSIPIGDQGGTIELMHGPRASVTIK